MYPTKYDVLDWRAGLPISNCSLLKYVNDSYVLSIIRYSILSIIDNLFMVLALHS